MKRPESAGVPNPNAKRIEEIMDEEEIMEDTEANKVLRPSMAVINRAVSMAASKMDPSRDTHPHHHLLKRQHLRPGLEQGMGLLLWR